MNLQGRKSRKIYPRTDTGNAELFAFMFGDRLRFDHKRGIWLQWQEHWWDLPQGGELQRMTKAVARERRSKARTLTKEMGRYGETSWARTSESVAARKAMLELARSEAPISDPGVGWDRNPMLLGAGNGVVDLISGRVRSGQRKDLISAHSLTEFDSRAKCPRWNQFLIEVFDGNQDLIDFVHKAVGYSMTGDISEQCLFVCYGPGANGKGVLFETLRHVLGGYGYNLPFSAFELQARPAIPNDICALVGRRFVTSSETNESARLNAARIKMLTGGDMVTARMLYKEFFEFKPVAKFWLAFNHKPQVDDDSEGFWRRVHLIPFLHQFKGNERDPRLTEKLLAEAPGILAWAVRGCLQWQEKGLTAPEIVKACTHDWREDADPLAPFLEESCTTAENVTSTVKRLRKVYESWARDSGAKQMTKPVFNSHLEARGFRQIRTGHDRTRTWQGICPKVDVRLHAGGHGGVRTDADKISPLLSVVKGVNSME